MSLSPVRWSIALCLLALVAGSGTFFVVRAPVKEPGAISVTKEASASRQAAEALTDGEKRSIAEQIRAAERWFTAHDGQFGCAAGVSAPNPAQQLTVQADAAGFAVNAWKSGATVKFSALGATASPVAERDRLTWQRGPGVEEWLSNGERGPEHGFTLAADDDAHAPRKLSVAVDTALAVAEIGEGEGLAFFDAAGTAVLRYDHALALDANERPLPMKIHWAGNGRCDLLVDDAGAEYPILIDPLISTPGVQLLDDEAAGSPGWGSAVAMDGGFLAVGGNVDDVTAVGQVSIFERKNDGGWSLVTKVTPSDGALAEGFGAAVGLMAGRLVVGAPSYQPAGWQGPDRPGALYVYERQSDGTWPQVAKVEASDPSLSLALGSSLSLGVDRVAAGTSDRFPNAHEAAYIFARQPDGSWTQEARMVASDWVMGDGFGKDVALYGPRVAVTSLADDHDGLNDSGAVYVFERNGLAGTWEQVAKIAPDDAQASGYFGQAVALSANRLAVSANGEVASGDRRGSVYVFEKPLNGAWVQKAKILPFDSAKDDNFGRALSLDVTTLLIGSAWGSAFDRGRAYLYGRDAGGTSWTLKEQLEDFSPLHSTSFGFAVALRGDVAVVGSFGGVSPQPFDGLVTLYTRSRGEWGLTKSIGDTPAEVGVQRHGLGRALALHGDLLLAGAPETSNQSRGGANVGAAYLFERHKASPNDWALRKVLIGADSALGHRFGAAVALHEDAVVIGAPEAGGTGAAYLFLRDQGGPANWGQAKKWTGAAVGAKFGSAVAVDVEVAAVGSPGEDGQKGKVRVYQRDFGGTGAWGLIKTLDDPVAAAVADKFGAALCLDADRLLVGSPGANAATVNGPVANGGRAYLFAKHLGGGYNFGQQDTMPQLLPAQGYAGRAGGLFGTSVALDGDTALIGEPGEPGAGGAGRAYVFERNQGGLEARDQKKQLVPPVGQDTVAFGQVVALKRGLAAVADTLDQVCLHARNFGGADVWGNTGRLRNRQQGIDAEKFGAALAFDGTLLAVGEPGSLEYNGGGAIRLYEAKADGWVPLKQVTGGDTDADDTLGASLAMRDGWLLVGAPGQGNLAGAAYFFRRNAGGPDSWGSLLKIAAADGATGDQFGDAVALDGRTAVVGSPAKAKVEVVSGFPFIRANAGAAYFFSRNQGGADAWGQVTKVVSTVTGSTAVNDYFGRAVAVDGASIAVGLPADAVDKGRVLLYAALPNGAWGVVANIQPATVVNGDFFGAAVSVSGETLVVGAPGEDHASAGPDSGSIYVFERAASGQYPQAARLNAPVGGLVGGAKFGSRVVLEGGIGLVGAPNDSALATNAGAAFMLQRKSDGTWAMTAQFRPPESTSGAGYGGSLALQGTTAAIGASGTNLSTGTVYVYERWAAADWHLMQTLVSTDAEPLEFFGSAVAVDGHVLAVGSQADDDAGAKAGSVSLFLLKGRPYDAWRRTWFGDAVVNDLTKEATQWGDVADPDGDGQSNIEEAYAGTNPTQFNARRPTTFFREGDTGFFVARWQRDATFDRGIQARPQYSTDLRNWFTDGGDPDAPHQLEFHDLGGPALGTVEARLHAPDFPSAFLRLQLWRE